MVKLYHIFYSKIKKSVNLKKSILFTFFYKIFHCGFIEKIELTLAKAGGSKKISKSDAFSPANAVGSKNTEAGVYKSEAFMPAGVNKSDGFFFAGFFKT